MLRHRPQAGLTLVELMISLALGLLVVAAVGNIFIANRAAFRSQEALAEIQQNGRIAFEILAQELRAAGNTPCGIPSGQVANLLNNNTTNWWSNWAGGLIQGYEGLAGGPVSFGGSTEERVSGTDGLIIRGTFPACEVGDLSITGHSPGAAQFSTNVEHCALPGDVLLACDYKQAALFQVSAVNAIAKTLDHGAGAGTVPGNCSTKLGLPAACASGVSTDYAFDKNGTLSRYFASFWFVGNNDRGGRSLFRARPRNMAVPDPLNPAASIPTIMIDIEEIAPGIDDFQIEYLARAAGTLESDYKLASLVGANDWNNVVAVRIELKVVSTRNSASDGKPVQRTFLHVVSLRNQEVVE
ncbi:MAG: pilus assembly protein PilW [Dechloromonas sp.]|nr:MAG: pilus assembly protein PilW [Dechloromonas sp.]